jgi:antitoxin (DNA-binding transcriptional repressor) of toxin-antitoxin stability system
MSAPVSKPLKKARCWVFSLSDDWNKMVAIEWHYDYYDWYNHYGQGGVFMCQSVSAVEARQKLGEILNRVALRREEIIIERAGKKIARLSPIDNDVPRSSGKLDFRKAAGLGKEIWKEIDVDSYLRRERQEWT